MKSPFCLAVITIVAVASATGQGPGNDPFDGFEGAFDAPQYIEPRLVPSHSPAEPGQDLHLAVDLNIAETWVYYGPEPGTDADFVIPARLKVSAGPLEVGRTLWPEARPYDYDLGDLVVTVNSFWDRAVAYVPLSVPEDLEPGEYRIEVTLRGQVCGGPDDVCINLEGPNAVSVSTRLVVGSQSSPNPEWTDDAAIADGLTEAAAVGERPTTAPRPIDPDMTLWAGLGLALLAGLILNVMPCVLPIIPLRIYSLVGAAGESRRRYVTLGLAFAAGMMLFFIALAVVNGVLNLALGRAFSWSQQWQSRPVRVGMTLVLVAVAANLFGLFTVTVPRKVAALEGRRPSSHAHVGSVGMGLMMAILATPCSFGILLAALAWGQTQPLAVGTAVFLLIGVGMAAPHVVLAAFPKLLDRLPKPGRWMELMKQSMGFVLLLVAVWLLSTLSEVSYPFWVTGYAVVLAMLLWVWGAWVRYDSSLAAKLAVRGTAVVLAVAVGWWMLAPPRPATVEFAPFDRSAITSAREQRPVVLKFTASWCVSCLWIEATVYRDESLPEELDRRDAMVMKADVTDSDSPAADFLDRQFGLAPPLSAVYPPGGGEPILLTGRYDKAELLEALDAAVADR